jgi:hypothetical protein
MKLPHVGYCELEISASHPVLVHVKVETLLPPAPKKAVSVPIVMNAAKPGHVYNPLFLPFKHFETADPQVCIRTAPVSRISVHVASILGPHYHVSPSFGRSD